MNINIRTVDFEADPILLSNINKNVDGFLPQFFGGINRLNISLRNQGKEGKQKKVEIEVHLPGPTLTEEAVSENYINALQLVFEKITVKLKSKSSK